MDKMDTMDENGMDMMDSLSAFFMEAKRNIDAGEPPALHIASDAIA